jgi:hypothetical protein
VAIVLLVATLVFHIPFTGSFLAFLVAVTLFIFANLMLGYLISTAAKTQMQAMQMTFFIFLPSILLSGFMFPFRAMPEWAQAIGQALPITHFLRMVREIVLKGAGFGDIIGDLWPLTIILLVLSSRDGGIDATARVMADFPDFHLDFYVSMRMAPRQVMVFHGEEAVLTVRAPFNAYAYADQQIEIREADGRVIVERFGQAEQYRAQANAFNASVLDGVPYGCPLEFSRGNQAFIDMIYAAAGPRPA